MDLFVDSKLYVVWGSGIRLGIDLLLHLLFVTSKPECVRNTTYNVSFTLYIYK